MIGMLPLAAGDSWITLVVVVVIMIVSAISQAAGKQKQPPQGPQPRPRPRPPIRPAQAGGGRQDPVARELEEFLRRAGGGRQQPARRPPPAPVAQPVATARPVPVTRPVQAEVLDELEIVESDLAIAGRAPGRPGSSLAQAAHAAALAVPETTAEAVVESAPSTAAAGLAALLASPTSLRQAILLSEILQRPEHRWR